MLNTGGGTTPSGIAGSFATPAFSGKSLAIPKDVAVEMAASAELSSLAPGGSLTGLIDFAIEQGFISEAELNACDTSAALLSFVNTCLGKLALYYRELSTQVYGDKTYDGFFGISLDMAGCNLLVDCRSVLPIHVPVRSLPPSIAESVNMALSAIRSISFISDVELFVEYDYWMQIHTAIFDYLDKHGLIDDSRADEALEALNSNAIPEMEEGADNLLYNRDINDFLALGREYIEWRDLKKQISSGLGSDTDADGIPDLLLRWIWNWRSTAPELYRHPLTRWVRLVASAVRRHKRWIKSNNLNQPYYALSQPDETYPLEFATPVMLGTDWESYAIDSVYDSMSQTGEPLSCALSLEADAFSSTHAILRSIAIGYALLFKLNEML